MKLCLNMIVKNESARIERALASAAPFITSWVIVDTGSTDDTREKIVRFFEALKIPGEIREEPFFDWSQARNAALDWARKLAFAYEPDYFLLMDADMELVVNDHAKFTVPLAGASYDMLQVAGSVHYLNRRLIARNSPGRYLGVTHEYLDVPADGMVPADVAYFKDYADGANRPEKFKRDIRLLKDGLKKEPDNVRYFFYLACSYRDAGQPYKAVQWFQRRIDAGGWEEEVWQAHVNLAHCYKDMGRESDFIRTLLDAYNRRPTRAEPMYDLAKHYRDKGMNAPALAAAEAVEHLPKSTDALFVNDFVYKAGIQEEIAISAWYVPSKRPKGLLFTDRLSMQASDYWNAISGARQNIYHYLRPLSSFVPSFQSQTINFTPPPGWVALNPSVCLHHDALHCNVRCVNYRIDEQGRYMIRNTETGEITNDNPINTRNFVLYLGRDPFSQTHPWEFECYRDGNMPVEFPLVIGFEDMRIWSRNNGLLSVAAVRQLHADGTPEQVLSKLVAVKADKPILEHRDMKRMLRPTRECEKNWAPIVTPAPWPKSEQQLFMWRPGTVINADGEFVVQHNPGVRVDNISGSSQVIPWMDGYIAILHSACNIPGSHLRHYYHRFVLYDGEFKISRMSVPFYFDERGIEFCAGLCAHPTKNELVISYGFQDNDARIATVNCDELGRWLCVR